jgi:hypothetical protein
LPPFHINRGNFTLTPSGKAIWRQLRILLGGIGVYED